MYNIFQHFGLKSLAEKTEVRIYVCVFFFLNKLLSFRASENVQCFGSTKWVWITPLQKFSVMVVKVHFPKIRMLKSKSVGYLYRATEKCDKTNIKKIL